jgi:PKD repeat protein
MKCPLLFVTVWLSATGLLAQRTSYRDTVFIEYFRRGGPGWVASDATISMPLPGGRSLWLMGDTNLDDYTASDTSMPCLFHVRNSLLVQDASNRNKFITILDSTKTGVDRTPVKLKVNDTTLFWPGHGFVKGDTAYTFWARYHSMKLTLNGMYLAKIYIPSLTNASAIKSLILIPNLNKIEFGNAVLVSEDSGYVYIYGHKPYTFINDLYVARFPYNNPGAAWEYYNGSEWVNNVQEAAKIIPNGYVSPSFSVIKIGAKYYCITQEIGFLVCGYGRRIYAYSSDSPAGPFTDRQTIYIIRDKYRGSYLVTYNATAHPEFTENNEILVSYNVNNTCPSQCSNAYTDRYNADLYRPKFIRVPLAVLDSGIQFVPEPEISALRISSASLRVKFDASFSIASSDIMSYTWNFGDGSGDTTTNLFNKTILHTYSVPGIYTAKVTISDETGTATASVTVNLTTTGLDRVSDSGISIYPNPAEDRFTVSLDNFHMQDENEILVKNTNGQIILRKKIIESQTSIQLQDNSSGLYFVQITGRKESNTFKLIMKASQ